MSGRPLALTLPRVFSVLRSKTVTVESPPLLVKPRFRSGTKAIAVDARACRRSRRRPSRCRGRRRRRGCPGRRRACGSRRRLRGSPSPPRRRSRSCGPSRSGPSGPGPRAVGAVARKSGASRASANRDIAVRPSWVIRTTARCIVCGSWAGRKEISPRSVMKNSSSRRPSRHRRHALGPARAGRADGQLDGELGALADLRGDDDPAAVLADDLLRDGQAQARAREPPWSRRRPAKIEARSSSAIPTPLSVIVTRADAVASSQEVATSPSPPAASSEASMALVTMFRTARWMPSGSRGSSGRSVGGRPVERDAQLRGARLHQLDHVGDDRVQVGRLEGRLALLREREHVHHEVVDLRLVLLDDRPALGG